MLIGGLQKSSLIDYPEKISAIVFTQGCNLRCGYCHNPELVQAKMFTRPFSEKKFFEFLKIRRGKLDAVTITGGEPTLQSDLPEFIAKIKKLGFLVKLDTNGRDPQMLKALFKKKLLNYIAMDIKAPLNKYEEVCGILAPVREIQQSINLIMKSGIDYEFRTTVVKGQLTPADLLQIGQLIKGARLYILQRFEPSKTNDPSFMNRTTYSDEEFERVRKKLSKLVQACRVR